MTIVNAPTQNAPDALQLHVFRVEEGLGNAILLKFPDETCAIVDWGTQKRAAFELALSQAKKGIRVVVATHAHADHTLGIAKLFDACQQMGISIGRFVYPTSQLRSKCYLSQARFRAKELGIPTSSIGVRTDPPGKPEVQHVAWEENSWEMVVLAPLATEAARQEVASFEGGRAAGNQSSAVVLFAFEGVSASTTVGAGKVLLPGDATHDLLKQASEVASQNGRDLHNQVLVVPHHGGSNAMPDWLNEHVHGVAVVSARTNSRHHPNVDTLQSLARHTCSTTPKLLFCTSYALACREQFANQSKKEDQHLVRQGPCFGHVVLHVPRAAPAVFVSSSVPGEERRPFGWCGYPIEIRAPTERVKTP
jgi:beta-lactamase superfamily II metal-dependent hydrolase